MFQFRRILLSGLVALLMVGMVAASDAAQEQTQNETDRSYIGTWTGRTCLDSMQWKCIHIDINFIFDFPL